MKNRKIGEFFSKQRSTDSVENNVSSVLETSIESLINEAYEVPTISPTKIKKSDGSFSSKVQTILANQIPLSDSSPTHNKKTEEASLGFLIERDPGLRKSIWDYPTDTRDEIRRAYLVAGPYQVIPNKFSTKVDRNGRKFLPTWFKLFSDWLEYSPSKDAAYCLQCFLFVKPSTHFGSSAFTVDGFHSWKKVNDGKNCSFLVHEGSSPNSYHKKAVKHSHALMNPLQHIERIVDKQSSDLIAKNRLRLRVSIVPRTIRDEENIYLLSCG